MTRTTSSRRYGGGGYQAEVYSGPGGGSDAQTSAGGHGFPGSGPSSGSGGSDGGKVAAASGGETQIRQPVGKFAQIVHLGAADIGTADRQRPIRRDWNGIVCFSCGKSGHSATRCPALDESFPFMLPGWRAETTPGGFIMISPRVAVERRRTEKGD